MRAMASILHFSICELHNIYDTFKLFSYVLFQKDLFFKCMAEIMGITIIY